MTATTSSSRRRLFTLLWLGTTTSSLAFVPLQTAATFKTSTSALRLAAPHRKDNHPLPEMPVEIVQDSNTPPLPQRQPIQPTPVLVEAWQKYAPSSPTATLLGLSLFLATAFSFNHPAWAAMSGGRVGGGGYGRSAPTMSRPAPRTSYGGGGGGGGYGYSRPNVYINPGPTIVAPFGPPIISPFSPFMPFSPYGFGGGVAVARGPSFFDVLFFGAVALVIANTVRGFASSVTTDTVLDRWSDNQATPLGPGTTVAQISVALQVPNRDDPQSILRVLPRLAQSASTEKRAGLQNLTSQVALELLRRKSQIVSASTSSQHFRDATRAQQVFGQKSIRERSKFEKESFSRFRGTDWGSTASPTASATAGQATMAVVTLLIEIDGDSTQLPNVSSMASVEDALRKIASDARVGECLQSAEILWTPEDRNESLSARDVVADYPELRQV